MYRVLVSMKTDCDRPLFPIVVVGGLFIAITLMLLKWGELIFPS